MSEPSHGEIEELLGVYALDAVDPETAVMVEHHLEGCVKCSAEVDRHHEVAGLLANSGGASPAPLWDGIASQLDGSTPPSWDSLSARLETGADRTALMAPDGDVAPDGPDVESSNVIPITAGSGRKKWAVRGAGIVAVAAAAVAVVLGVQVNHLNRQVNALSAPLTAAEQSALRSPTTRQISLTALPGSNAATSAKVTVVLTKSGTGFVEAQDLSTLKSDQTYQLWGVVGHTVISLGLMGTDPTVVPFSVAGTVPVSAFAITVEHSGGVVASTHQPVVSGPVTA